ncbi:MAG TPA: transglycosylase SLT domain-containing protein [Blastocatellia bacterium]|nr:transglycosylase SLT domain-containing protein [Blastocatellia bacterium]
MFGSSGPLTAFAQTQRQPAPPSISDLISRSEQSYVAGEEALIKGHSDLAMRLFDQALDIIMRSGRNLSQNPRLDTYYKDLVYRINQHKNELSGTHARQQPVTRPGQSNPPNDPGNRSEPAAQKSPQPAQGKEAIGDKENVLPSPREELPASGSRGRAERQQADELQNRQEVVEPALIDELSGISESDLATVTPEGIKVFGRYDFEFSVAPPVFQFLNYFVAGRGRSTMEAGLKRAGRYRQMAEKIFKEERVPLDLIWLAQAESVWKPAALSRAAAKGIWQFIPSTGSRYGLAQTSWIDDRSHPEKSTRAAARYLRFLHDYFAGDWLLAMAAYNSGEARIANSIARCGYADFWEIHKRSLIPQETRNYVPIILSIIIVSKNQKRYGFNVTPDQPLNYDTFELAGQTDLKVVADLLTIPYESIQDLNPELRRGTSPAGQPYTIKLPKGMKKSFETAFAALPEDQRVRRVVVPREEVAEAPRQGYRAESASYQARRGDTLAALARRHGVSVQELARMNGLSSRGELRKGQSVRIPKSVRSARGRDSQQSRSRQGRFSSRDVAKSRVSSRGKASSLKTEKGKNKGTSKKSPSRRRR